MKYSFNLGEMRNRLSSYYFGKRKEARKVAVCLPGNIQGANASQLLFLYGQYGKQTPERESLTETTQGGLLGHPRGQPISRTLAARGAASKPHQRGQHPGLPLSHGDS